jgi:endo-1,4-beta-xylanase
MKIFKGVLLMVLTLPFFSCATTTMRNLADQNDLLIGTAIQAGDLVDENREKIITDNFNLLVSENGMKWAIIHPTKQFWNWSDIDHMLQFADEHNIAVKWHTLVWHNQLPGYASSIKTREEGIALLKDEINTIMTRYKGKIPQYDVVNEAINDDGSMRESVWYKVIGPDYIDIAFQIAHEADPNAELIYNDYSVAFKGWTHAEASYQMVKKMVDKGVPIDAVGFQLHLAADQPYSEQAIRDNIKRYEALGLKVEFSEIDIRVPVPTSDELIVQQTAMWQSLMDIAVTEPAVESFVMWGYSDVNSWIPKTFGGYGDSHWYDTQYKARPVYQMLKNQLKDYN